jgi:hypothetical protein
VILRNDGASFAVPALGLLIFGVGFYALKRREFDGHSFFMLIVPLALVLYVLLWLSQPAIGDERLFHRSAVRVNEHIYNLAGYHLGQLAVYECDSLGIVCQAIYRGTDLVSLEPRKECLVPPRFVVAQQTISLIIQCETIFTHPVPQ